MTALHGGRGHGANTDWVAHASVDGRQQPLERAHQTDARAVRHRQPAPGHRRSVSGWGGSAMEMVCMPATGYCHVITMFRTPACRGRSYRNKADAPGATFTGRRSPELDIARSLTEPGSTATKPARSVPTWRRRTSTSSYAFRTESTSKRTRLRACSAAARASAALWRRSFRTDSHAATTEIPRASVLTTSGYVAMRTFHHDAEGGGGDRG